MARRISWTNNSSGHSGTYVYRAETLDPQNLPAPVATVDPVAQGATAEWIDSSGEYGCFAVQDFDGQGSGTLSAEVCVNDPFANVAVGDEVEGGIYAGTITYADSRQFHIIAAKQAGEVDGSIWGNYSVATGATDPDDGYANQQAVFSSDDGTADAFYHCRDYASDGFDDWYMPSRNELGIVYTNLAATDHPEFLTDRSQYRWASTEESEFAAKARELGTGGENSFDKRSTERRTRPIRRVPV